VPDPPPRSKVMLSLELPADQATLAAVRQRLGLEAAEIDARFGVVPIDPDHGLYTVLVTPEAAERVKGSPGVSGPFANPPIEPI
jgi:hypothetical protein